MTKKDIPSFTYSKKKNRHNNNKKKINKNNEFTSNEFTSNDFPNNDIIKIIPINSNINNIPKMNNTFPMKGNGLFGSNISQLFDAITRQGIDDSFKKIDDLEDIKSFKIDEKIKYDELDDNEVTSLTKLINISSELDKKKKYSFDMDKLKLLISPLKKLKEFVGMNNIKDNVVKQILYFLQNLDEDKDMMHTVITGPPGVGKTKLAYTLGEIYFKMGVFKCKKGKNFISPITGDKIDYKFTLARRSDLIGEYVGHTAMKTQKVIDDSIGGVLFIDEAYSLGNSDKKDTFSKECIDTLNQNLTEKKGQFAVIIAGYENELENCFFSYNDGLRRRFPFRYEINSYTFEELGKIFINKIKDNNWKIDETLNLEKNNKLYDFFQKNYDNFTNFGGDMEILLFSTKIAHSIRIFGKNPKFRKQINLEDLFNGYKIFKETKKKKDEPIYGLYI